MSNIDYDLFVIGAGSGGVRAARIAATHGARVAIAEEYRFGGTCVIRGCVPKKLFVYASRFSEAFEDAQGFGWHVSDPKFDWSYLVAAKDKEIARLEGLYRGNLERHNVSVFHERAQMVDAHTVRLSSNGKLVTAEKILIATGGRPNIPPEVAGVSDVITSDEAFDLDALPRRIVIVGGGYIAVEFAGIFAGLGVDTTLVYRGEQILRGFDEDMRSGLNEAYQKKGIRVILGQLVDKVESLENGLSLILSGGEVLKTDKMMCAIGRSPNVADLGLEEVGVKTGQNGRILVDDAFRTSVSNIFAVGDVCDRVNLTPVAIREGHAFADMQFGKMERHVDYEMIPTAVFSTPEIGTVGLTEEQAREKFAQIEVYKSQFRPMKATLSGREERMIMKLLVDVASGRVIGCHVLGEDAGEIAQMAAIAMRMGALKRDFDSTMALHPSAAEELVTMSTPWVEET